MNKKLISLILILTLTFTFIDINYKPVKADPIAWGLVAGATSQSAAIITVSTGMAILGIVGILALSGLTVYTLVNEYNRRLQLKGKSLNDYYVGESDNNKIKVQVDNVALSTAYEMKSQIQSAINTTGIYTSDIIMSQNSLKWNITYGGGYGMKLSYNNFIKALSNLTNGMYIITYKWQKPKGNSLTLKTNTGVQFFYTDNYYEELNKSATKTINVYNNTITMQEYYSSSSGSRNNTLVLDKTQMANWTCDIIIDQGANRDLNCWFDFVITKTSTLSANDLTFTNDKSIDVTKPIEIPKVIDTDIVTYPNTIEVNPVDVIDNPTVSQTIDFSVPDTAPTIDFSPILNLGNIATQKFPFSIPFDVYRLLNIFVAPPKEDLIFTANINDKQFNINLNPFKSMLPFAKTLLLISFDISLILLARKLSNPSE